MNKWTIVLAVVCFSTLSNAAQSQTCAQFVAEQKVNWAEKGWDWNQAKVERDFADIDVNKDGLITYAEKKAWWVKKDAEKAARNAKAVSKSKKQKQWSGQTQAQYLAAEKTKYAEKGWRWKPEQAVANFAAIDVNKDGRVTPDEKKAWWAKMDAAKKNK